MMLKCWSIDAQQRPSFNSIREFLSSYSPGLIEPLGNPIEVFDLFYLNLSQILSEEAAIYVYLVW